MSKKNMQTFSQSNESRQCKLGEEWQHIKDDQSLQDAELVEILSARGIIDKIDSQKVQAMQTDQDKINYCLGRVVQSKKCEQFYELLDSWKQAKGSNFECHFHGETITDEASSKKNEYLEEKIKEQKKKWEKDNKDKWEKDDKEREKMWEEHDQEREEGWEKRVKDVDEKWKKYMKEHENKWDMVRDGLCESDRETRAKLELKNKEYEDMTRRLTEKENTISQLESEITRLKELSSGSDLATTDDKLIPGNRESLAFKKHIYNRHGRMGKTKQQTEKNDKIAMKENQIVILKAEIRILQHGIVDSKAFYLQGTTFGKGLQPGRDVPKKNGSSLRK